MTLIRNLDFSVFQHSHWKVINNIKNTLNVPALLNMASVNYDNNVVSTINTCVQYLEQYADGIIKALERSTLNKNTMQNLLSSGMESDKCISIRVIADKLSESRIPSEVTRKWVWNAIRLMLSMSNESIQGKLATFTEEVDQTDSHVVS